MTIHSPKIDEHSPIQLIIPLALVAPQENSLIKSLEECPDGSATYSNSFRMLQYPQIKKKNPSQLDFPSQSYGPLKFLPSVPLKSSTKCGRLQLAPTNMGTGAKVGRTAKLTTEMRG